MYMLLASTIDILLSRYLIVHELTEYSATTTTTQCIQNHRPLSSIVREVSEVNFRLGHPSLALFGLKKTGFDGCHVESQVRMVILWTHARWAPLLPVVGPQGATGEPHHQYHHLS